MGEGRAAPELRVLRWLMMFVFLFGFFCYPELTILVGGFFRAGFAGTPRVGSEESSSLRGWRNNSTLRSSLLKL